MPMMSPLFPAGSLNGRRASLLGAIKLAIGAFLALATMELVALRVSNYKRSVDPVFGRIMMPGHTLYSSVEGHGRAHYIDHGIRRKERWDPQGPAPVLVLGDSYTEALQVTDDQVFSGLLEQRWSAHGIDVPVLNFSSSGFSAADYVAMAPKILSHFNPRWVIVQAHVSDFSDDAWKETKAHFEKGSEDEALKVVSPQREPRKQSELWLVNRFALTLCTIGRIEEYVLTSAKERPLFRAAQGGGQRRIAAQPKAEPDYPISEELELLDKAYGRRLTILLISSYNPRDPLALAEKDRGFLENAKVLGIDVVELRASYPGFARDGIAPFGFPNTQFNSGHWNARGHAAAADLLEKNFLLRHTDVIQ